MEQASELIPLVAFQALPAGTTRGIGVRTTLNLPKAILGIRHHIGTQAAMHGGIETFHMPERGLYAPLAQLLVALLPRGAAVDHEAVLKKLSGRSALRTDLSIRRLECFPNERLDAHDFAAVIEIKSVFYGERLSESDLLDDLEKLLNCEATYSSKCFFALVGLKDDLTRVGAALSKFLLHNAVGPISISLPAGKTAWLHPSARFELESPYVYVWTVSSVNSFSANSSDYVYTVFEAI